jgi:hypothetical protein
MHVNKLKTKSVPAIIMLIAMAIAAIMTFYNRYPVKESLVTILFVMVIFLVFGQIVKIILDKIEIVIKQDANEDGEVIEKKIEEKDIDADNAEKSEF